jgi:CRP-like cAMP-binding protein/Fe-S-cluster-containing hydrogenase component 2
MTVANPYEDLRPLLAAIPLFAKIKPKMLDATGEEVGFRRVTPGEILVRQGEFTEDLLVVLEGIATGYRSEPDGTIENMGSHGVHDWFGEMTALSHQPQFATVKAESSGTLLVVNAPLFKKLYTGGGSFRDLIDARYRERALAVHLRTAPIFKGIDKDVLEGIARQAQLLTIDEGAVIAEQGKAADAVFLVRSGIVKEMRDSPDGPRVVAFLRDNSSFGERSLAEDALWRSSMVAMTRVDVVRLDRKVFQTLFARNRAAGTRIQQTVGLLLAQEQGQEIDHDPDPVVDLSKTSAMDLMVGKQAVKGGEALLIDLKKCTRCNACVEACVSVHEDRVPRLSKRGIRSGDFMLTSACYNCTIPECMMGCNYGAIRRDVNGAIHFILPNCVGCSACEIKCPYGVIRMATLLDPDEEKKEKQSFFARMLPFIQRSKKPEEDVPAEAVAAEAAKPKKPEKRAIKCDLCAGLPFEACVYNCPCGAISRVDPADIVGM